MPRISALAPTRALRSSILALTLLGFATPMLGESAPAPSAGIWSAAFYSFFGDASVTGGWRIVSEGDQRYLELDGDFRSSEAPDLKLFLSPKAASKVTGDNATSDSVRLGQLESFEGKQRYAIPADADLTSVRSLVLHCEAYSKLWGTAPLALVGG